MLELKTTASKKTLSHTASQEHTSIKNSTILLIEDDIGYCNIFRKQASKLGIDVTVCRSVSELAKVNHLSYSAVIIDYDLGSESPATGVELAHYFDKVWGALPIILISERERKNFAGTWPKGVKGFVGKERGMQEILRKAIEAVRIDGFLT